MPIAEDEIGCVGWNRATAARQLPALLLLPCRAAIFQAQRAKRRKVAVYAQSICVLRNLGTTANIVSKNEA
jgi:hypothetical protein